MKSRAAIALLLVLAACTTRAPLPQYDRIPAFQMTDSEGSAFTDRDMQGKVWIADVIYTTCPAICPVMSARMQKLSKEIDPRIHLLSISVDPDHDTPAALHAFAAKYGAPTPQWAFLTGTPETVHLLAYSTLHLGDIITKLQHSSKFALIDSDGYIRGYYSSFDTNSLHQLTRDAASLFQH